MAPPLKSTDKKKPKKSSKSSGEARKKDKERKSKDKDRKSSKKEKTDAAPVPVATSMVAQPTIHDPDAIQLFRRYDRNRSGVLTRLDFLQLLKDYADPASSGWGASMSRPPLSLTDMNGIPLGYQRADRNSEFEAGQLFERYDRDHTGALTLDTFHVFFADFKPQLRSFVEESNYRALSPPPVTVVPEHLQPVREEPVYVPPTSVQETSTHAGDALPSPKTVRAKYRSSLWRLRKICKDELFDQREHLVQKMKAIREDMMSRQQSITRNCKRRSRTSIFSGFDNGESYDEKRGDSSPEKEEIHRYEAMENDLDRMDELIRYVRRYLNKGNDVSLTEMQKFIEKADEMKDEAQSLAMNDYGEIPQPIEPKKENEPRSHPSPPASALILPSPLPSSHHPKQTDLERLLRVKDQMIYQLLQERTVLRKERAAVEANLKQLSDVSTREMKKWARLTDDMQTEIEQLQSQLRSQSHQRT